jgi:hypothetical protein
MRIASKWAALLALGAATVAGCSATDGPFGRESLVGPVGPSYSGGRATQMFPNSPSFVADVKDAMTDVGMHSFKESKEPSGGTLIEATTTDNRRARVTVQTRGLRNVVTARIGLLGDEPLSRAMLDRISFRQGSLPASALPADPLEGEEKKGILTREDGYKSTLLREKAEAGGFNQSVVP